MKNSFIFFTLIASVGSTIFATQSPTSKDKACSTKCVERFEFAFPNSEKKELLAYQRCIQSCVKKASHHKLQSPLSSPRDKTNN